MRRYLADRADLVGAIRLPNTAFKANAGTEVTTDILFLQKRAPGTAAQGEAWRDLAPSTPRTAPFPSTNISRGIREMMLGADAARRHDVPRPRADADGRADAGAAATGRRIAAAKASTRPASTRPDRARPPPETTDLADIDSADVKDGAYADPRRAAGDPPGRGIRDREGAGLGGVAHPRHAGRARRRPRRVPHPARRCARRSASPRRANC